MEKRKIKQQTYDYVGIILSILCGLHCLVTPIIIVSLPQLKTGLTSPWAHSALILVMIYIFNQSVLKHYKIHKSIKTLVSGIIGLTLIIMAYFIEVFSHHEHEGHGHHAEIASDETLIIILAITGSVLLICSHIFNIKKCRCLSGTGTC